VSLAVCASAILALGALAGGSSAGVHAPDHEEHGLGSRFVDVRFRESAEVRGAGARLRAAGSAERRVRALLDAVGARDARPLVPGASQEKLERIAERVERRTGADTPDLSAWYRLELPRGTDVEAALEVLESSPLAMAATTFFRGLGGAVGAAVLGAVFAARIGTAGGGDAVGALGSGVRADVIDAVGTVFAVAAPIAGTALAVVLLLKEVALAGPGAPPAGEGGEAASGLRRGEAAPAARP